MSVRSFFVFGLMMLSGSMNAFSQDVSEEQITDNTVKVGGYGFWQFGQIVSGNDFQITHFAHQWTNGALIGLKVDAQPNRYLRIVLNPEFKLNYPFPEQINRPETVRPFGVAYIHEADAIFTFGDEPSPFYQFAIGMFPYKYNPEARNLGEYLFRTGTYPTYVITDFEFPMSRLLGIRMETKAVPNLDLTLLFTSEPYMYPLYDFSLSGLAGYNLFGLINLGAGVNFARLLPAVDNKTSPVFTKNDYPTSYNEYITQNGDTAYYTFKATKVMGRITIDPKALFPSITFFGPEDLKLYAEIAAIGIEGYKAMDLPDSGYPAYYNDLDQRMPRMFGFNIPAFKLLDILSFEAEYFPSLLPNDYYNQEQTLSPIPHIISASYNPDDYDDAFWRWSLYTKKEILKGFSISFQAAFDHLRTTYWNGSTQTWECMTKPGDWHWDAKIGYSF